MATPAGAAARLAGKCFPASCATPLPAQRTSDSPGAGSCRFARAALPAGHVALRFPTSLRGRRPFLGRTKPDSGPAGFGQTDRDRLFGRARAVLATTDVMDLLAHELAGLGRSGLALASIAASAFDGGFLGHVGLLVGLLAMGYRLLAQPPYVQ
jgi:hypothetical protein